MRCLKCGRTAELDRVVVDIVTGTEVGALCEPCLDGCNGPTFRGDVRRRDADCAVCAGTPHYELPPIDCLIRYTGDRPDEVEYVITDATLRLCADHLRESLAEPPEEHRVGEAVASR